jgi:predicted SAM-dependent methyltransferase
LVDRFLVRCKLLPQTEFDRAVVFVELTKPLPWGDGTASVVYLGELLEHLTRDDAIRLLAECYRVLAPGGIVRVRVPDNARFWRNYLDEYESIRSRPRSQWNDTHTRWVEMFFRELCVRPRLLSSAAHYHKWAWDEVSLTLALERVGFTDVRRRALFDSAILDVAAVETREDLTIEGSKPAT